MRDSSRLVQVEHLQIISLWQRLPERILRAIEIDHYRVILLPHDFSRRSKGGVSFHELQPTPGDLELPVCLLRGQRSSRHHSMGCLDVLTERKENRHFAAVGQVQPVSDKFSRFSRVIEMGEHQENSHRQHVGTLRTEQGGVLPEL